MRQAHAARKSTDDNLSELSTSADTLTAELRSSAASSQAFLQGQLDDLTTKVRDKLESHFTVPSATDCFTVAVVLFGLVASC